jgi:DNA-binding IclR family transcriptional regulator
MSQESEAAAPPVGGAYKYPIESVESALKLLVMLAEQGQVRVTDVAAQLGVSRSTGYRFLATLQHHGFVRQEVASKAYVPGPALVELALEVLGRIDIRAEARPFIERLSAKAGETVHLAVLLDRRPAILLVDCVESTRTIRAADRTGTELPAHHTAAGKALLAALPLATVRQLYPEDDLPAATQSSITSFQALERELEAVRRRGYATNFSESEPDLHAVAVAILDRGKRPRGAITISAPASRLPRERVPDLASAAAEHAAQIGVRLD